MLIHYTAPQIIIQVFTFWQSLPLRANRPPGRGTCPIPAACKKRTVLWCFQSGPQAPLRLPGPRRRGYFCSAALRPAMRPKVSAMEWLSPGTVSG